MRSHDLTIDFLLLGTAALPVLYGISAIGTKLRFYEFQREPSRITPQRIPSDPEFMTDMRYRSGGTVDVLEAEGEQRLRALALRITEACQDYHA